MLKILIHGIILQDSIPENGLKELAKTKTGNTGDLNLMLINMLRSENLKAYPILISTVGNGFVNLTFPNVGNFNYVIAAVEINKNVYLYDATSKQSKEGILPSRVWNSNGLLLRDDKAEVISLNNIKTTLFYPYYKSENKSGWYRNRTISGSG